MLRVAERFKVVYDGPAIGTDKTIDASTLGSSLIALSELVQSSQEVLHPDGVRYRVRVTDTGDGSFEVILELAEVVDAVWNTVSTFFSSDDVQAIDVLIRIFGPAGGLIWLLRRLKGRKPDEIVETDDGQMVFRSEDIEVTVDRRVGGLYMNKKVRKSLVQFVQPVRKNAIESLTVEIPEQEPTVITPEDRPLLDAPLDDEPDLEHTVTMTVTVETIIWRSHKWEFREPHIGLFWAAIEDADFLRDIEKRTEPMFKGDLLVCVVRVRQWDNGDGTYKSEYAILSVLDHRPGERIQQPRLDDVDS